MQADFALELCVFDAAARALVYPFVQTATIVKALHHIVLGSETADVLIVYGKAVQRGLSAEHVDRAGLGCAVVGLTAGWVDPGGPAGFE